MKAKFKKSGSNSFTINLNCTHCGKPINRTSIHFGMDCEDGCSEKQYSELLATADGFEVSDCDHD